MDFLNCWDVPILYTEFIVPTLYIPNHAFLFNILKMIFSSSFFVDKFKQIFYFSDMKIHRHYDTLQNQKRILMRVYPLRMRLFMMI